MAIKHWNPATKVSRGNMMIALAETVADLNAPKLAEIQASTKIDCAITEFKASSSSDAEAIDWLCNPVSEQLPSSTSHEMDALLIKTSGQDDEELLKILKVGEPIYLWRRDGLPVTTEPETGQKIWVWKITVTSVDPAEAGNTFIGLSCNITVADRSKTAVAIVA